MNCPSSFLVADGNFSIDKYLPDDYIGASLPKGDMIVPHVMAASILAKTYRDDLMIELDKKYPMYNWKSNKGYSSSEHIEAIKKYGVSPHHRTSYKNIKALI